MPDGVGDVTSLGGSPGYGLLFLEACQVILQPNKQNSAPYDQRFKYLGRAILLQVFAPQWKREFKRLFHPSFNFFQQHLPLKLYIRCLYLSIFF